MEEHGNMAPGQQNYPKTDKQENNKNALPGEQILTGALQEDQLDKFKENAAGSAQAGNEPAEKDVD